MPDNLGGALWLQFALSVTEEHEYRRCKLCNKPFRVTEANRADRLFCSTNCRVKSYQRRQAKARKMRAGGAHLREIVEAVESDMQTVKRWLGKDK